MLAFLSNPWITGIGSSIIVFIITYIFSNRWLRFKAKLVHAEHIERANSEIIQAMKPYVAEKGLPEAEITKAIINSIARKHKVHKGELYSVESICEELIREIVESVYITADKKQEYSNHLNLYLNTYKNKSKSDSVEDLDNVDLDYEELKNAVTDYKVVSSKLTNYFSPVLVGLSLAISTFSFIFFDESSFKNSFIIILFVCLSLMLFIVSLVRLRR